MCVCVRERERPTDGGGAADLHTLEDILANISGETKYCLTLCLSASCCLYIIFYFMVAAKGVMY